MKEEKKLVLCHTGIQNFDSYFYKYIKKEEKIVVQEKTPSFLVLCASTFTKPITNNVNFSTRGKHSRKIQSVRDREGKRERERERESLRRVNRQTSRIKYKKIFD